KRHYLSQFIAGLVVCISVCVPIANAAPAFYFTTHADGTGGGDLSLGVNYGDSGTLYLAANSDIHIQAISLDVLSSNPNFFKFTSASVKNNDGRWVLIDAPLTVAPDGSSITSIGGGALPGILGTGIGAGSGLPNPTVVASLTYSVGGSGSFSNLSL